MSNVEERPFRAVSGMKKPEGLKLLWERWGLNE
jgi:hypothetical protein